MGGFSPHGPARSPRVTESAHFQRTTVTNEPSPSMPAVLKRGLLHGVGITTSGSVAPAITQRLEELGATSGDYVLVHGATTAGREALDEAWEAIREHKARLIVLLSPAPEDAHHEAARAGLENLARTLSIEWARNGIRAVTIHQADDPRATAELVAFLASKAGAYYAGCAFTLRPPTAPRPSPP
jgi:NAD(P)-dependent dehydrogenase (short-subunit alcohol dehydrogenase family)